MLNVSEFVEITLSKPSIYSKFLNSNYQHYIDKIYTTVINKDYNADCYFPKITKNFVAFDKKILSDDATLNIYQNKSNLNSQEYNYLNCLHHVLNNGEYVMDRTKTGTLSVPHQQISFDINSIDNSNQTKIIYYPPFITTKSLYLQGVIWELIWFLSGNPDAKWLQERKVKIWDGNTSRQFLDSVGLKNYEEGMIGPGYGPQWVNWGGDWRSSKHTGINQIKYIIETLKNEPASRRAVLSAWNVADLSKMALPPCHMMYIFKVSEHNSDKKKLNCMVILRSNDLFLGCPFNIASASLLTILLSRTLNMLPGKITLNISDAHIYSNHIEQVKEQLLRTPLELPELRINKEINTYEDMIKLTYKDFETTKYYCWPTIKADMAA